jgi:hypothetical protein
MSWKGGYDFNKVRTKLIYPAGGGKKFHRNVACSEDGGGKFLRYFAGRHHISEDLILIRRFFFPLKGMKENIFHGTFSMHKVGPPTEGRPLKIRND